MTATVRPAATAARPSSSGPVAKTADVPGRRSLPPLRHCPGSLAPAAERGPAGSLPPGGPEGRAGRLDQTICEECLQDRPDEYGLSTPTGELGFCSEACFVAFGQRMWEADRLSNEVMRIHDEAGRRFNVPRAEVRAALAKLRDAAFALGQLENGR